MSQKLEFNRYLNRPTFYPMLDCSQFCVVLGLSLVDQSNELQIPCNLFHWKGKNLFLIGDGNKGYYPFQITFQKIDKPRWCIKLNLKMYSCGFSFGWPAKWAPNPRKFFYLNAKTLIFGRVGCVGNYPIRSLLEKIAQTGPISRRTTYCTVGLFLRISE